MNKQKGYVNIDFTVLFLLAGIGILSIVFGVPYVLWWLFTNFTIVPV